MAKRKNWFRTNYEVETLPTNLNYDPTEAENISVYDAADIWASNGKDEDYTFGYSEDELNDALDR